MSFSLENCSFVLYSFWQVVNRDGSELDAGYELPRAGTKRSVKERLGNQLDSSFYGNEVVSKRYFHFPLMCTALY